MLSPRDAAHSDNLDRIAAYIRNQFEGAKVRVAEQPFDVRGTAYRNITALFGPETGERIVVGAHYDAAGPLPGADDNASGIAGLIELAHLLGKASSLAVQVELLAFTLEEPPFFRTEHMGSLVHARSLKRQGVPVRVMVSLEMIDYFSHAEDSQSFPISILKAFYPSRGTSLRSSGISVSGRRCAG
jgi:hypothetical protein